MSDGFWHKAWQFALLFALVAMLAGGDRRAAGETSLPPTCTGHRRRGSSRAESSAACLPDRSESPNADPKLLNCRRPRPTRCTSPMPPRLPRLPPDPDQRTWDVSTRGRRRTVSDRPRLTKCRPRCGASVSRERPRSYVVPPDRCCAAASAVS